MTKAQKIVDALIESDDDSKKKSMPDWLKKIKGIKDEEGGDDKSGAECGDKEPAEKKSGSDSKGSGESVKHTW